MRINVYQHYYFKTGKKHYFTLKESNCFVGYLILKDGNYFIVYLTLKESNCFEV